MQKKSAVLHVNGKPFALVLETASGWEGAYLMRDGTGLRSVRAATRGSAIKSCYTAARDTGYVYSDSWYPDGAYENYDADG